MMFEANGGQKFTSSTRFFEASSVNPVVIADAYVELHGGE